MIMCSQGSSFLTTREALRKVERELGFPNPVPFFLPWYYVQETGGWVPIVDFDGLAQDIKKHGLVSRVADVVGLPPTDSKKKEVIALVRGVVEKHRFAQ